MTTISHESDTPASRSPHETTSASPALRTRLALEYTALYLLLPLTLWYIFYHTDAQPPPLLLLPLLFVGTIACTTYLLLSKSFDNRSLWSGPPPNGALRKAIPFLWIFPPAALATVAFVAVYDSALLFEFVRERPVIWIFVMLLYPVLSVYPQGIIWRVFLFHRYKPLFRSPRLLITASAIAFSWLHVIFNNPIAVLFTLPGGLLFARTYLKTQSAGAASIEHALYGCFVFTAGLGQFFYLGAQT